MSLGATCAFGAWSTLLIKADDKGEGTASCLEIQVLFISAHAQETSLQCVPRTRELGSEGTGLNIGKKGWI